MIDAVTYFALWKKTDRWIKFTEILFSCWQFRVSIFSKRFIQFYYTYMWYCLNNTSTNKFVFYLSTKISKVNLYYWSHFPDWNTLIQSCHFVTKAMMRYRTDSCYDNWQRKLRLFYLSGNLFTEFVFDIFTLISTTNARWNPNIL